MTDELSDVGKNIIKIHIEELHNIKTDAELIKWLDAVTFTRLASDKIFKDTIKKFKEDL